MKTLKQIKNEFAVRADIRKAVLKGETLKYIDIVKLAEKRGIKDMRVQRKFHTFYGVGKRK